MNFAAWLLPERVVGALGWTLFHSLWQGVLAALGFAGILVFTRRHSARVRYALGLMALVLVLAASLATFFAYYSGPGMDRPAPAPVFRPAASAGADVRGTPAAPAAGRLVAFFTGYFARNLPLFVTLWLLGVLFLALRFTGGLLYVQRLKYRQNRPLPAPWPDRLAALAERAGLKRPLRLLESLRLRAPVVIGHLKPVLLVPAGLVTGLPAEEVEALLAHELAHIMRRDYLVNVLQHAMDILYFFHPGVRWISACVRQEREHCCDDIAVELCGDVQGYARALARLQVEGLGMPEPALAAAGPRGGLLRRIARLLAPSRLRATFRPRLAHDFRAGFVSALLLVLGLFGMLRLAGAMTDAPLPAPAEPAQRSENKRFEVRSFFLDHAATVLLQGSVPGSATEPAATWIVDGKNEVAWYLALAGKEKGGEIRFSQEAALGRGAYDWYLPAGSVASAKIKGAADIQLGGAGERQEGDLLRIEEHRLQRQERQKAEQLRAIKEDERRLEHELQAKAGAERAAREEELEKVRAEQEMLRQKEQTLAEAEREQLLKKQQELAEQLKAEQEQLLKKQQESDEQLMAEQERLLKQEHLRLKELEEKTALEESRIRKEAERLRAEMRKFTQYFQELVKQGLVNRSSRYEIKLSASVLMINGKVQPAGVHEKIKNFYESLTGRKLEAKAPVTIVQEGE